MGLEIKCLNYAKMKLCCIEKHQLFVIRIDATQGNRQLIITQFRWHRQQVQNNFKDLGPKIWNCIPPTAETKSFSNFKNFAMINYYLLEKYT